MISTEHGAGIRARRHRFLLPTRILRDRPGLLHVGADLVQEVVDAVELARGTQMLEKVDLQGHTVEVALVADEVGFDLAGLPAEGGVRADVEGGGVGALTVDPGVSGINAVGGELGVAAVEVGGREAQTGASAPPWTTRPRRRCGRPSRVAASSTRPSARA